MDRADSTIRQIYGISVEEYEQCCELGEKSSWDENVPTTSLFHHEGKIQFLINPKWWLNLTMDERVAVMRHENRHYQRWKNNIVKCECGKDKHGFMSHMYFCPKWESLV